MRIKDVLKGKEIREIVMVRPQASVRELLSMLAEHNVGALVVCEGDTLEGIVSERDVVRQLAEDEALFDQPVSSIMTSVVETCTEDDTVDELMKAMTDHRIRHVPVLTEGRVTGIISIGDVVKHRIADLEFERDQLDHYVHQT